MAVPSHTQSPKIEAPEQLLTVAEVANVLNCCTKTVRRIIASGILPAIRLNRQYRVRRADLAATIAKKSI